jgi:hypothetical protein
MRFFSYVRSLIPVVVALWSTLGLALNFSDPTGVEVRGDFESIRFDITVNKITRAQITSESLSQAQLDPYLDVILKKDNSLPVDRKNSDPENSSFNHDFYRQITNASLAPGAKTGEFTAQFSVEIFARDTDPTIGSLKETVNAKEGVKVTIRFNPLGAPTSSDTKEFFMEKLRGRPTEAPKDSAFKGVFRGAEATWTVVPTVIYSNSQENPSTNRKPTQMLIMAVEEGTQVNLKAKKVDLTATDQPEADTTCLFVGGENCLQCPGNSYLLPDQSAPILAASGPNTGTLAVRGLEVGKDYRVFLQYGEGLKRSQCALISPSDNITMAELMGDESQEGDPRCFIATAAFGSPMAKELSVFRWFRSRVLFSLPGGRDLVRFYYRTSPPLADWIAADPLRQTLVRGVLWPLWGIFFLAKSSQENPGYLLIFMGLSCLALLLVRRTSYHKG